MSFFVEKNSIVRKIWGKGDTVLFIFAGASAEFALNKAVDWLYFTGKLPADPIGRLFSTVRYAQQIVFSELDEANKAIDNITAIHVAVEKSRQAVIPGWAYRDVLFMLIHYSIASFELLERKLSLPEKEEVYNVFYRVGCRMNLTELPLNYDQWMISRTEHLKNDLQKSDLCNDLFKQYKKHLGGFRYWLLLETQKTVVPGIVSNLLKFNKISIVKMILPFYKFSRIFKLDGFIRSLILPSTYKDVIKELDKV
jgi:hypothetical protein